MKKILIAISFIFLSTNLYSIESQKTLSQSINDVFEPIVAFMAHLLFWDPFEAFGYEMGVPIPIVVIWLIFGAVYFTLNMNFVNIKGFKHAINLTRGVYDNPNHSGEVSHFQALATALSATVGLGNIASVAIAISIGGPGATFWMIIAGLLGMSSKFVEVTLGVKYRDINSKGETSGGPMYYLSKGFKKYNFSYWLPWRITEGEKTEKSLVRTINLGRLGKILSLIFAFLVIGASIGGGNMFQANQSFAQLAFLFPVVSDYGWFYGFFLAILVGVVVIGGIKSIARVTEKIVPFMAAVYILAALIIIGMNITKIGDVFLLIFNNAFEGDALKGGIIGILITGFQRAAFSNEAGIGSASIAHSAVRTNEPISEGIVALLEPFIDTVIICTMTALVIIFTGAYTNPNGLEGTQLTSQAFASVFSWFPYLLLIIIFLFAFSTMISWSYYGLKGFNYLFKGVIKNEKLSRNIFYTFFLLTTIVGASSSLGAVLNFSDMMILSMAFPNIFGLLILAPEVKADLKDYFRRIKNGSIKKYK
jgi:AGCS family alanine or glycine:cation symporter